MAAPVTVNLIQYTLDDDAGPEPAESSGTGYAPSATIGGTVVLTLPRGTGAGTGRTPFTEVYPTWRPKRLELFSLRF